jgi:hypothetical protein
MNAFVTVHLGTQPDRKLLEAGQIPLATFRAWSREQLFGEVRKLMQEIGSTYKIGFA